MLSKNRLKYLKSLQQKKNRQEEQLFLVEGEKPLAELMQARQWRVVFWGLTPFFVEKYAHLIKTYSVEYELLTADELHQLSTLEYQKAGVAVVSMPANEPIVAKPENYTIALDNIQDPGNLGTILRLADWYGFPQVVCSPDCVEVYNPKTIVASMGSFLRVSTYYTDLPAYLAQYASLPTLGALMEGENLHKTSLPTGGILVLGNEGHGISPAVQACLTLPLTIPRFGGAESLNVAMATAVFLDRLAEVAH
ncbi:MAG: RNA methyltransferase [Bacteroidetes bacterium]|nr:MAG: RNA methyltransferase [Bacteroidota bacterium]